MAERDRCTPQVTGFAADVQKILDQYPRAEDIMEAEEQDAELKQRAMSNISARYHTLWDDLPEDVRSHALEDEIVHLRKQDAQWNPETGSHSLPELEPRLGRYYVVRSGTWLSQVMVEARDPRHAQEIAKLIPEHVWELNRVHTEPKRHLKEYGLGGVSLSDTREPWRPQDPAEVEARRERARQTVQERRERNNTAALTQTEGYTDVEVAARVLYAIQYPYIDLDDTDSDGQLYWRRILPQAQLFIDAGFVRRETLLKGLAELSKPTQSGRYAEAGYNDHFNDGLSAAEELIEEGAQ